MMFILLLLFFSLYLVRVSSIVKYEDVNLTILDQISSNIRPYLPCQNITDISNTPLLKVADDFYIPPMSTFILNNIPFGIDNCKSIIFSIAYKRSRYTMDPENIILTLMKSGPYQPNDNDILFKKTFLRPSNGWNINSNDPGIMILIINIGDKDDLNNEFDISSSSIIYGMKIWVSLWVTLKRDFLLTGLRENMFYWITYQIPQGGIKHNEVDSPFKYYNKTSNYYFIDKNNLLRKNLVVWTNALTTENILDINSHTYNMAWKVDLLCKQTIHVIDINITDEPTNDIVTIEPPYVNITSPPSPIIIPDKSYSSTPIILLVISLLFVIIIIIVFIIFNIRRCYNDNDKKNNKLDLVHILVEDIDDINKESNIIIVPKTQNGGGDGGGNDDDGGEDKSKQRKFIKDYNIEIEVI